MVRLGPKVSTGTTEDAGAAAAGGAGAGVVGVGARAQTPTPTPTQSVRRRATLQAGFEAGARGEGGGEGRLGREVIWERPAGEG